MEHEDMAYEDGMDFFADFYFGAHHIPSKVKPWGSGWCVNHNGDLSTFDFDKLTRLVFLAHDRCVRVSIQQGGPGSVKIMIWQRYARTGSMSERHPTIDEALELWRKNHPLSDIRS